MSQDYDEYDDDQPARREARLGDLDQDQEIQRAKERTNVPGILLIVLGVLNLLGSGYFIVNGLISLSPVGKAAVAAQAEAMNPQQKQQMQQMGWDMGHFIAGMGIGYVIVGCLGILLAIGTIIAGVRMRGLRGFALAVLMSIVACIPFLSPAGCCLFGQVVGIWSLVVLLSSDVKSAFR